MTNISERYEKGLKIASEAILKEDPDLLGKCLRQFKKINTPPEVLERALSHCPLSLLRQTPIKVRVFSETLQREIVLGEEFSWDDIIMLSETRPDRETIKGIMQVKSVFPGEIVEIRRISPGDITEAELNDF
jgi:hypothetical protein